MEGGERQRAVVVVDGGVDVFVAHKARELMPKYETRLRKFQHSRALTEALTVSLLTSFFTNDQGVQFLLLL